MSEDVKNCELAKSAPEHPTKAYDAKHGSYADTPPPVEDTAVNATKLVEPKTPWKGLKSGS